MSNPEPDNNNDSTTTTTTTRDFALGTPAPTPRAPVMGKSATEVKTLAAKVKSLSEIAMEILGGE